MAKRSNSSDNSSQYITTQQNLDSKGKTNKKLKRNPQASKYLTARGKELKEQAEAYAKEHFGKGRRTLLKKKRAEEEARKLAELKKQREIARIRNESGKTYKKGVKNV